MSVIQDPSFQEKKDGDIWDSCSSDDATPYILRRGGVFSPRPTQFIRYDLKSEVARMKNDRRKRDFVSWLKALQRGSATKKMMVCGKKSSEVVSKWLKDCGIPFKEMDLDDVVKIKSNLGNDENVYLVYVQRIDWLLDKSAWLEKSKAKRVVFCCESTQRCPKNRGHWFVKMVKKIVLV
ncbi:hypothetical protein EIN_274360 [Entamoeba invadens IP1]|uniref:Uncharacterized protein n=1 Tax=Entamoeba invadens IP1 TaxID=370355 RepID=A0A0A1U1E9_ENTIV|nr:hypothetical protein EIN_274360 [Entamoeba invadens IP1]ELP87869.1 hypothetical protein EIN_274360 [Entamoeba invadens IP1]|eukprot:XP_004254640.1 hypothetical protein EIN_274360 [Entamoeba invadens IP1]